MHTLLGMLPGYVAGHYDYMRRTSSRALARFANARFYHSAVTGPDLNGKRPEDNRLPVLFELLSINTMTLNTSLVPGATGNVVPVKPINNFLDRWRRSAPGRCRRKD